MTYLSSWMRTSFQRTVGGFLNDTCKIEVLSLSTGDLGQTVESWSVLDDGTDTDYTNLPCRVIGADQSDTQVQGSQETMTDRPRLVVPSGSALAKQQRATIASTGHAFNIGGIITDLSDNLFITATIVRRQ